MKAIKEFTIDRSKWLPHEMQNGYSALRTVETADCKTRMCCLGIYLEACDVSTHDMIDVGLPAEILDKYKVPKGLKWLLENNYNYGDTSADALNLAEINDDSTLTLEERETKIKEIFKKNKVKVTFKNKLQGK